MTVVHGIRRLLNRQREREITAEWERRRLRTSQQSDLEKAAKQRPADENYRIATDLQAPAEIRLAAGNALPPNDPRNETVRELREAESFVDARRHGYRDALAIGGLGLVIIVLYGLREYATAVMAALGVD